MSQAKPPTNPPFSRGRTRRTAQVLGRVVLQTLGRSLGIARDDLQAAELLTEHLGALRGPLMKIGQIMATVPGMVPPEYAQELRQLQSHAPEMGPYFVKRRMRGELGEAWQSYFSEFNLQATFAASLGQVHQATTLEGKRVACKLQYPDMHALVEKDLRHLDWFCKIYRKVGRALDPQFLQEEIQARLFEELDYTQEARHTGWFSALLASEPGVVVPNIDPALSSQRLLTMTWLEGQPFLSCQTLSQATRNQLASLLFRGWWRPFYQAGVLHGDPHLGNYTYRADADLQLQMLDFGCVRVFSPALVVGVLALFQGLQSGKRDELVSAYEALGFAHLSGALIDALTLWARFLYGPLLDDRVRAIDDTYSGEDGRHIAVAVHTALREAGGVRPPREFVFLDRAAVGIGSALIHARAQANWHQLFLELTDGLSLSSIQAEQANLGIVPGA